MKVLPRIVLFVLQLMGAWYLTPVIKQWLPNLGLGQYEIFVYAILYAITVTLIGHIGALVLKEVRAPTGATLVACLVLALAMATVTLIPAITQPVEQAIGILRTNRTLYPLIGALVGYFLRR
jgi:hypothetical protein